MVDVYIYKIYYDVKKLLRAQAEVVLSGDTAAHKGDAITCVPLSSVVDTRYMVDVWWMVYNIC